MQKVKSYADPNKHGANRVMRLVRSQWRVLQPAEFGDVEQEPNPSPKLEDYDNFTYEDEQKPTPPVSRPTNYDDEQQMSPPMMSHHDFPGPSLTPLPQGPYIFSAAWKAQGRAN